MNTKNDVHTEERKGYTIHIQADDSPESPREWDNAGVMVCWHKRYNLGDEQPRQDFRDWLPQFMTSNCEKLSDHEYNNADNLTIEQVWNAINREFIFLPLYLYDHSGISISTSSFVGRSHHGDWDSGQVGYIYISKKQAVKEWGNKLFTKKVEEKTVNYLVNEVKTYDDYLTGNVYGFIIEDQNGEMLDSCWGCYPNHGDNKPSHTYCLEETRSIVDYLIKKAEQKQWESLLNQSVEQDLIIA
jgi:hypothetical protein